MKTKDMGFLLFYFAEIWFFFHISLKLNENRNVYEEKCALVEFDLLLCKKYVEFSSMQSKI